MKDFEIIIQNYNLIQNYSNFESLFSVINNSPNVESDTLRVQSNIFGEFPEKGPYPLFHTWLVTQLIRFSLILCLLFWKMQKKKFEADSDWTHGLLLKAEHLNFKSLYAWIRIIQCLIQIFLITPNQVYQSDIRKKWLSKEVIVR